MPLSFTITIIIFIFVNTNFNEILGLGLMAWSPVSFGITLGEKQEDSHALITKIMVRVCFIKISNVIARRLQHLI